MASDESAKAISALVVFSAPLVKSLTSVRLPPTYVGVPRLRPSSREVQSAWIGKQDSSSIEPISFLIKDEDGRERRMTTKEKREAKWRIALEKKESKKKRKINSLSGVKQRVIQTKSKESDKDLVTSSLSNVNDEATNQQPNPSFQKSTNAVAGGYHQLPLNSAAIEEEIADLRGDRDGVPPVALMPCIALQANAIGISTPDVVTPYRLDEELSRQWSSALKDSFKEAEEVRNNEEMREMVYRLMPEPWNRMRPETLLSHEKVSVDAEISVVDAKWSWIPLRQRIEPLDSDLSIICALLHSRSDLHVSCGSKFGCDFLLYDGPRDKRHAFAGMRIIRDCELPSAYDLHGYVRCLNTAGKLSLLAKVDRNGDRPRVGIVDLALEKIMSTTRFKKRARNQTRRDVAKNLAKK